EKPGDYYKLRAKVHGIPVRSFDNYCAIEKRTGSAVFLAVNELSSGQLLMTARPLSQMQQYACGCGCEQNPDRCRARAGQPVSRRRMYPQWYFDRDTFTARFRFDTRTV